MSIELFKLEKTQNRVWFDFGTSRRLLPYFHFGSEFFIEYDRDISIVPDSILVIPFLTNILPIAWVLDAEIILPEIDEDFYKSIPEIKRGYEEMYPMISFRGKVTPRRITRNTKKSEGRPVAFFSGGVDAHNTLIRHLQEKPVMVTIWGSDVFFNDREGWLNVSEHATMTASAFGLDVVKVKSNFRSFLNEGLLSTIVTSSGDGWWRGFQHGIGIIGHAAPITWIYDSPSVYIASSRSSKDIIQGLTCASHPSIDGKVRFAGTQVIHDSFEMSRQDKIECIVSFTKKTHKNIQLHVCWESSGGKNCNTCEKCLRTILGIISAGANPDDFGLHYNAQNMILIKNKLHKKTKNLYYFILIGNYIEIWNSFNANNIILQYPELQWFKDFEFEKIANTITKRKTLLIHPWKRLFRM